MSQKTLIITINYNQSKYTLDCIQSVLKSSFKDFIIYLLDNGSDYKNYLWLKENLPNDHRVLLNRLGKNIGYVGGINYALKNCELRKFDFIAFLNNDTIVAKESISALIECCVRYHRRAIVAGKVYRYDEPKRIQSIGTIFSDIRFLEEKSPGLGEIDDGSFEHEMEMDMLDDVLWVMPVKIIDDIGYYNSHFFFGSEQADYALRAKRKGYKLIYTPKSKIWHKGGVSFNNSKTYRSPSFVFLKTKGSVIYHYRHMQRKYFFLFYSKRITKYFVKLLFSMIKKDNRKQYPSVLKGCIFGLYYVFVNRKTLKSDLV